MIGVTSALPRNQIVMISFLLIRWAAKARGGSGNLREWERNIVNLEHSVRPADLPPGRERWVLSRILSAEEMHVPLRELRDRDRLKSNLLDLLRHKVAGWSSQPMMLPSEPDA